MTELSFSTVGAVPLSPRLFGQFLERPSWHGETGPEALVGPDGKLPPDVRAMLRDLAPPLLRFPGGTDVDFMDWTDMIDRAPGRPGGRPSSTGRDGGTVGNRFGLHEYFALRDELRCDSLFVVNLRDALYRVRPLPEAALHAAGLLAYVNSPLGASLPAGLAGWPAIRAANGHPEPFDVRLVAVGNETYFLWPPADAAERARLGVETDEAAWDWFANCLLAYADALHAVDPTVELVMDGLHDPWRAENTAANRFRDRIIRRPEIRARYRWLSSHYYAPLAFWNCRQRGRDLAFADLGDDDFWHGLLAAPGLIDTEGRNVLFGPYYDDYAALGYRLAITEWNWNAFDHAARFESRPCNDQLVAALGASGLLHGLLRQAAHVGLANQSMLLGTAWGITAIRADPAGREAPYWLPQGRAALLYARHHGDRVLPSTVSAAPFAEHPPQFANWYPPVERLALLDIVVTADATRRYVHIINRSLRHDLPLRITLPCESAALAWRHVVLTGDPAAPTPRGRDPGFLETTGISTGETLGVTIPKHSASVLIF